MKGRGVVQRLDTQLQRGYTALIPRHKIFAKNYEIRRFRKVITERTKALAALASACNTGRGASNITKPLLLSTGVVKISGCKLPFEDSPEEFKRSRYQPGSTRYRPDDAILFKGCGGHRTTRVESAMVRQRPVVF